MKLARATFLGVRGVRDATFDVVDAASGRPRDVVLLAGGPASGKTRMLEVIVAAKEAVAAYGVPVRGDAFLADGEIAKVVLAFWLDEEERHFAGTTREVLEAEAMLLPGGAEGHAEVGLRAVLGRYTHAGRCGKVEYFPASRTIPAHDSGHHSVTSERALRPTKAPHKYALVRTFVRSLVAGSDATMRFARTLARLSPTCRYDVERSILRSRAGVPATLDELSDAERDAVLLAATAVAIDLNDSLVLIDRPDLFAAPGPAVLDGLRALGDDNQIVAAVAAPAAFAPADDVAVVDLEGG